MKSRLLKIVGGIAVLVLFVMILGIARRQAVPDSLILEQNIVFGQGGDQPLKLDLTRPKEGKGPFPALVLVHGGGWVGGDRDSFRPMMYYFSQMGIVCITIDYRLAPKHTFPAQLEDAKCAVRWMRANAGKYNVDPNRIAALGGSAGAHLVALLGTTMGQKRWEGTGGNAEQSSAICAMVCLSGPYDLEVGYRNSVNQKAEEGRAVRGMLESFLGGAPEQKASAYKDASPITYVNKSTVPALLTHGIDDVLVPIEQSDLFYAKLKKAGVDAELIRIEGAGHADFGKKPEEIVARFKVFADKYLLTPKK